jgi:CRP-like cAMP-binding protein
MEKDYRMAVFSKSPVFGQIPIGILDELADACDSVEYKAGEIIFEEGDMPSDMLIIDEGTAELIKKVSGSKGLVLAHLKPGDILEINSFMDGQPHFLSVMAKTTARVIKVPLNVFLKATGADTHTEHRILLEILKIQSVGLRTLNARFAEFLSRAAR